MGVTYAESKSKIIFNPSMGVNLDVVTGVEGSEDIYKSTGFNFRGVELLASGVIDPYASMHININAGLEGVELHEAFVKFPYIPGGFSLRGGFLFANFGRWNMFHTHSLPFVSQPRMYREYNDGFFLHRGLELSWLVPVPFYLEATFSMYDRFQGDTHDTDPDRTHPVSGFDIFAYAESLGYEQHGSHWHDPNAGDAVRTRTDVIATAISNGVISDASGADGEQITSVFDDAKDFRSWIYGGRLKTSFDMGSRLSVDIGTSVLYRKRHAVSTQFPGIFYDKIFYGADLTFFYHPPSRANFQIQLGVELLGVNRQAEIQIGEDFFRRRFNRLGFFSYLHAQLTSRYAAGLFTSVFEKDNYKTNWKQHYGVYGTLNISHFQYLRLEYSYYYFKEEIENAHRLLLQYNATIGFHSHGTQR